MAGLMDGASDGAESRDEDVTLMGDGGEDAGSEDGDQSSEDGDGSEDGDQSDDQHDDAKKEKLPAHVQEMINKRIGKEVGKRKTAEERATALESELKSLRERADAEDADIVLDAAREFGIVADVLPKGSAKGMEQLRQAARAVETLQDALEDANGDEVEIEGKTYAKADVRAKLKEWRATEKKLNSMYGGVEAQAKKEMMDLFRLGQQAKKAGWKPGQKQEPTKPKDTPQKKKAPEAEEPEGDEDAPPSRVRGGGDGRRESEVSRKQPSSLRDFFAMQDKPKRK